MTTDADVKRYADLLIEHRRDRIEDCACGWNELGKCHSRHVMGAVLEAITANNWIIPKRPYRDDQAVQPLIDRRNRLIRRSAGDSDANHTRYYAAQLLAAADELDRRNGQEAADV
jgi:hypothetical protein